MSEKKPKFSMWFHKFLIYILLYAWAAANAIIAVRNISYAQQNADEHMALIIIMGILLILLAVFIVKTRFDLAVFRDKARKELLIIGIAGGIIALIDFFLSEQGNTIENSIVAAIVPACLGIALYRYYSMFPERFVK